VISYGTMERSRTLILPVETTQHIDLYSPEAQYDVSMCDIMQRNSDLV
jgi:hypothetical protein